MNVLIVESCRALRAIWRRHLQRQGLTVVSAWDETGAIANLHRLDFDVIILDLTLDAGCPLAIADVANVLQPEARVIFVTSNGFFSDGSIFRICSNAAAYLPTNTPPEDMAALVEYHGRG